MGMVFAEVSREDIPMEIALYENAMQAVPLLLVALFLDSRIDSDKSDSERTRRWARFQDRLFTILGVIGFMTSMFIVAGIVPVSRVTDGIVLSALSGCISLPFVQIWRRFDRRRTPAVDSPPTQ